VQVNYDNLKLVLDYILGILRKQGNVINGINGVEDRIKNEVALKL